MNRMALGLAVGAGYVLGRTKKAKVALAVGGLAAGKRMNVSPASLGDLLTRQLRENPQLKEMGDQLRQDLSGVGKAASGAVIGRRLDSLTNHLHDRTAQVRDQLAGASPGASGEPDAEETEEPEETQEPEAAEEAEEEQEEQEPGEAQEGNSEDREAPEETGEPEAAGRRDKEPAKKKAAGRASAKKSAARTATTRTASAKRTTVGAGKSTEHEKRTAGARRTTDGARGRRTRGGGER